MRNGTPHGRPRHLKINIGFAETVRGAIFFGVVPVTRAIAAGGGPGEAAAPPGVGFAVRRRRRRRRRDKYT